MVAVVVLRRRRSAMVGEDFSFFFCFQRLLGFKSHNIVEFTQSGEKIVEKRK